MNHIIDTETIVTDAGKYRVEFIYDESADQPEDEGFVFAMSGRERYASDSRIDIEHGDVPDEVKAVLLTSGPHREDSWDWELHSGAALVRYLTLKGYKGVTLVGRDYRPVEPSTNRRERVYGVAWAPDDASDHAGYVKSSLKQWAAWAEGDVFGYRVLDPQGREVEDGSCWGYYGFSIEHDYVLSEARSAAEYDAKERVAQANQAGAGFVGVI